MHGNQQGHEIDKDGNICLSKLNEDLLKDVCKAVNGTYLCTTYNDQDIDNIAARIKQIEKTEFGSKELSLYEDQYPWFLGISWVLLALEWIL